MGREVTAPQPFHLWGVQAITERLGYRNPKAFYLAYAQGRVFAFKKRDPRDSRRLMWYSNADLMARCELVQVKQQLEHWKAQREHKGTVQAGHPPRRAKQGGGRQGNQTARGLRSGG